MKRATQRLITKYEIRTKCRHYKVLKFFEGTEDYYEVPVCNKKRKVFSDLLTKKLCAKCRVRNK